MKNLFAAAIWIVLCLNLSVYAARNVYVPEVLKPWKEWVLHQNRESVCPPCHNDPSKKICSWAPQLVIAVGSKQAAFRQKWIVNTRMWVPLPGSVEFWPEDILVDGKGGEVSEKENRPGVFLNPGTHEVSGSIRWQQRPSSIPVPSQTAIVSLTVDGKRIPHVSMDDQDRLWFETQAAAGPAPEGDRMTVEVYRKLVDEIPFRIVSRLDLSISGKEREIVLGRFLPDNTRPFRLECPFPARIEKDGSIRLQAKPGRWSAILESRAIDRPESLSMSRLDSIWPGQEIWVFEARRHLRTAELDGAPTIDPSQTDLPADWKGLPAYVLTQNDWLRLKEKHRGDEFGSDQITLSRAFWLDFDGTGFTIQDRIMGDINKSGRLSIRPGFELGRVDLNGEPQLVTQSPDGRQGIEVQQGNVYLTALGTFVRGKSKLLATGWDRSFDRLEATVNLPPGWDVLFVRGADSATDTWVSRWSLWDIFFVLVLIVLMARLFGNIWGAILAITALATYHVQTSLFYLFLNFLVIAGIARFFAAKPRKGIRYYAYVSAGILVLACFTFIVDQIRSAMYPQLDAPSQVSPDFYERLPASAPPPPPPNRMGPKLMMKQPPRIRPAFSEKKALHEQDFVAKSAQLAGQSRPGGYTSLQEQRSYDPTAKVQTGPGEPNWSWNSLRLNWSGPVEPGQGLYICLLPPWGTKALYFIRVLLVLALTSRFVFFVLGRTYLPGVLGHAAPLFRTAPVLIFLIAFVHNASAQSNYPTDAILSELEKRLTAPPDCSPNCAAAQSGQTRIDANSLRIELVMGASDSVFVSLPGSRRSWMPERVSLNGAQASLLGYDDQFGLVLGLKPGRNAIVLEGKSPEADFQLPFPIDAHNIEILATGWSVSGLEKGRVPGQSLEFHRQQAQVASSAKSRALMPDPIEPFLEIERKIVLRNEWQVITTVRKLAPEYGTVNQQIPLLENEAVISEDLVVAGRNVSISMQPAQKELVWRSTLSKNDTLFLMAPMVKNWVETWILDASSKWHVEPHGIALTSLPSSDGRSLPTWRPWPGERLSLAITQPAAVQGSTMTIESATLSVTPGLRTSEGALSLSVRSSLGSEMHVTLPKAAVLERMIVDNQEAPLTSKSNEAILPLRPGVQELMLEWKEPHGMSLLSRTPSVNLHAPVSNATLAFRLPENRWPLILAGPRMGPAMLFWGIVAAIILVSLLLGRIQNTPFRAMEWFLLFIGMTTANRFGGPIVILWFLILVIRTKPWVFGMNWRQFNLLQLTIILLSLAAVGSVLATIPISLLSSPNMQIVGNGSDSHYLQWYQDKSGADLPAGWVFSLPLWAYRIAMLAWSLYIAFRLPSWLKWAWKSFTEGGTWRDRPNKKLLPVQKGTSGAE